MFVIFSSLFLAASSASKSSKSSSSSTDVSCFLPGTYDYIIVGSGTSGSIVAAELSKNPKNSVLLIEEGTFANEFPDLFDMSLQETSQAIPQVNRGYFTVPQENVDNKVLEYRRAKMTGGCDSYNGGLYVLGRISDFNEKWNIPGWKWENDLEKHWNNIRKTFPFIIGDNNNINLKQELLNLGIENGFEFNPDFNNITQYGQIGIANTQHFTLLQNNGTFARTVSTYSIYLEPFLNTRDNLDLLVFTRVNKVLFSGKRKNRKAIGVEVENTGTGKIGYFYATKEVILCGGAIDTPKILMLSGIGDCNYLSSLGINCVFNVPGVGNNYQDHTNSLFLSPPLSIPFDITELPYLGDGVILNTDINGESTTFVMLLREIQPGVKVLFVLNELYHRETTGTIRLQNNNPSSKPLLDPKIFGSEFDRNRYVSMIRFLRNYIYGSTFANTYLLPQQFELVPGFAAQTDEQILQAGKDNLFVGLHASSTAAMGESFTLGNLNEVVVDNRLRVRGVKNLRVVDLSIAPTTVSANTNAVATIIGFRGAEIILEDN